MAQCLQEQGADGAGSAAPRDDALRARWRWASRCWPARCWCSGAGVGSTGFENAAGAGTTRWRCRSCWDIRPPRTLGAWLAGALLGLAGAVAQGLFRNPLADPYLLGSASARRSASRWCWWLLGASPATHAATGGARSA